MKSVALSQRSADATAAPVQSRSLEGVQLDESIAAAAADEERRLAETKELRLPKLVQEHGEATRRAGGRVWCHWTRNSADGDDDENRNSNAHNIKQTGVLLNELGAGQREEHDEQRQHQRVGAASLLRDAGRMLTNCQLGAAGATTMKVAPRATSFYCDKTPAVAGRQLNATNARRSGSETSQVVVFGGEQEEAAAATTVAAEPEAEELCAANESATMMGGSIAAVSKLSPSASSGRAFVASPSHKQATQNNLGRCGPQAAAAASLFGGGSSLLLLFKPKNSGSSKHQRGLTAPTAAGLVAHCCLVFAVALLVAGGGGLRGPPAVMMAAAAASEQPKQSISVHPEPRYLVAAGQQVKLTCHVANRQGDCAWLAGGGKIVSPSGRKYIFARSPADGDCSLLIKNASVLADDGMWQCQALAGEGELDGLVQSISTELVVLVPPERPQIKDSVSRERGGGEREKRLVFFFKPAGRPRSFLKGPAGLAPFTGGAAETGVCSRPLDNADLVRPARFTRAPPSRPALEIEVKNFIRDRAGRPAERQRRKKLKSSSAGVYSICPIA
jgi:hypothetical protein